MNSLSSHKQDNSQLMLNSKFFSMQNKKILIVDNDTDYVQNSADFLRKEGFEVTVCNDGIKALQEASRGQYQLILLDIILPNLNGFELLRKLRASNKTPVVIATSRDDLFDKIYGLEIGADDYLIKPVNPRELLARINVICRRVQKLDNLQQNDIANINDVSLCLSTREVHCCGGSLNLTGYEFEVLHFLILNAGNIVSKDSIGKYVHGRAVPYNDRSIDMHISNIRKKISAFASEQKIKTIRGAGYIFLMQTI